MSFEKESRAFSELIAVTKKLRSETGCPWDREQTLKSIRPYIIEEAYEVVDSINAEENEKLEEEFGDLIFLILFGVNIAEEGKLLKLTNVLNKIKEKMINRHPHVFGDLKVSDSKESLKNWEHIKSMEKKDTGILSGVPKEFPALLKAFRMQEKAARVGFDWSKIEDVKKTLREEIAELEEVINENNPNQDRIVDELGDVLFSIVNIARFLDVNPEIALEETNKKFLKRFQYVEKKVRETGKGFKEFTLEQLDVFWNECKNK